MNHETYQQRLVALLHKHDRTTQLRILPGLAFHHKTHAIADERLTIE
jgi:hypothetical protein